MIECLRDELEFFENSLKADAPVERLTAPGGTGAFGAIDRLRNEHPEFVQPAEIDLLNLDSAFCVVPNRGGEQSYALFPGHWPAGGLAGLTQMTICSRASLVILMPGWEL